MISERESRIVLELSKKSMTAEALAEKMGRSAKTIRRDILNIESELSNYGAQIVRKSGVGFLLVITNQVAFSKFIEESKQTKRLPITTEERIHYLVEQLLIHGEIKRIEDISNDLLVSYKTVERDLRLVKKLLSKYNLQVVSISKKGFQVVGDEFDKRWCIFESIMDGKTAPNHNRKTQERLEIVKVVLCQVFSLEHYEISQVSLEELILIVYLAYDRVSQGFLLKDDKRVERMIRTYPYEVASSITKQLNECLYINLENQEIKYIALQLAARQRFEYNSYHHITEYERFFQRSEKIVDKMLNFMSEVFLLDILDDDELYKSLVQHVAPFIIRIDSDMVIKNSLTPKVIKNYPITFLKVKIMLNVLFDKDVSDDEVAYITLYFETAIEKKIKGKKKRIGIVYDFNIGSAKLVQFQLLSKIHNECVEIDLIKKNEIEHFPIEDFNMFIAVEEMQIKNIPLTVLNDCKVDQLLLNQINRLFDYEQKKASSIRNQWVDSCEEILEEVLMKNRVLIRTVVKTTMIILIKEQTEAQLFISKNQNIFICSPLEIDNLLNLEVVSLLKL